MRKDLYPHNLVVYINYTKNKDEIFLARNAIEKELSKYGKWVGHGQDISPNGKCDTQFAFKTKYDASEAGILALEIIRRNNVDGDIKYFSSCESIFDYALKHKGKIPSKCIIAETPTKEYKKKKLSSKKK